MTAKIKPSVASGTVRAPASKSMAHRLLICAALAKGESCVCGVTYSQDILATLDCLQKMGADIKRQNDTVKITGIKDIRQRGENTFFCRESESTLRFLLPLLLLSDTKQRFNGAGLLMSRPMGVYEKICREKGLHFRQTSSEIEICGVLAGGEFEIAGNVSSQFISGLLFALTLCGEDSRIRIVPPIESRSYINMTVDAMRLFGVSVRWEDDATLYVGAGQEYKPCTVDVEGDYSGAAFLEAFNLLGGSVNVSGLRENSLQGDSVYRKYYPLLRDGCPTLDVSDCPDLAPILMTVAAAENGVVLTGTRRLKMKESDRGAVMAKELSKFGADIIPGENEITVKVCTLHKPEETLCGHNDHRVVMSLAVLASVYGAEIDDAQAVSKSFPKFFEVIKSLGIDVEI